MTRRKREIAGLANEQDFPYLVELALPPGGFRSVFQEIDAFQREWDCPDTDKSLLIGTDHMSARCPVCPKAQAVNSCVFGLFTVGRDGPGDHTRVIASVTSSTTDDCRAGRRSGGFYSADLGLAL